MKRARILRVLTRLNVGGPARQAVLLERRLRNEFPTTIAAGHVVPGEAQLDYGDSPVVAVPLHREISPWNDVRACRDVRRLIRETGAKILHTHMAKAGAVGRVAARFTGVRLVHTYHGHVFDGYFNSAVERVFIQIERALARRTDVLVAVSPEIRDQLLDRGIGRAAQYRVIPEGQDLDSFLQVDGPTGKLRDALHLPPSTPLVGVFGRIVPIKDHVTLIDAFSRLDGVHLAVFGDGEARGLVERRVHEHGVSARTHFLGWTDDVAAALADVDVVALTSRNEGTPVALIEAAAAARPVVATDVGGVRSVVRDGVTGLLVPPGDPEAVAAALKRMLADEKTRREMGATARREIQREYGPERLVRDTKALYEELLAR